MKPIVAPACPKCQCQMIAMAAAGGYTPTGESGELDHWYCHDCAEVILFDDITVTRSIDRMSNSG